MNYFSRFNTQYSDIFCTAKATHIFSAKNFKHICVSLDLNFNESLTNDIISFEQLGPGNQYLISGLQNILGEMTSQPN